MTPAEWLSTYWTLLTENLLAFVLFGVIVATMASIATKLFLGSALEACRERLGGARDEVARLKGEKSELVDRLGNHGEDIARLEAELKELPRIHVGDEPPPESKKGDLWVKPAPGGTESDSTSDLMAVLSDLATEMMSDLSIPGNENVREFFVAPGPGVIITSTQPRFVYYESEHPNLNGRINILENRGLILDVSTRQTPRYRMTEQFVEWLRSHDSSG